MEMPIFHNFPQYFFSKAFAMYQRTCLFVITQIISACLYSQPGLKAVNDHREKQEWNWFYEYMDFLRFPNVYGDTSGIRQNADFIAGMLRKCGLKPEFLTVDKPLASPVVYAEALSPGATQTIAFYAHYDGQPVNPSQWAAGLSPFEPQLATDRLDRGGRMIANPPPGVRIEPDWRIYARGSADDKAGVFAIIKAYESIIRSGHKAGVNIKFFFEGEEEKGSPNIAEIFTKYRSKLGADLWIICDGPSHPSGRKQIVFGVRGDVNQVLTVYGGKRPLHSGNYGNWAPNSAMRLAQLLATMKDSNGMVTIKGFYDDVIPLTEAEKKAISKIPGIEVTLKE
jgi:acetylornithine deacetylase/succinyl-diaminopimelate desuccinylase-like protein